ncbi:HAD-IIA family hydrolase [Nocardia sp. NPDC051321]|uniref:HAD-IIA family hydrolase n=1 Tax=Nocardia sp. NPDC051321 TaxID=3364323 RepID=UPI0037A3C23B
MRRPDCTTTYDGVICDLDGVVYRGTQPIEHAVEALAAIRHRGIPVAFATNNDTRSSADIAEILSGMGFPATPEQVVTAPEALAALLARCYPPGTRVAVSGAAVLSEVLRSAGMQVCRPGERSAIVALGLSADQGSAEFDSVARAVEASDRWYATNVDRIVLRDAGPTQGNGMVVRALQAATGRSPIVIGKPQPHLLRTAAARIGVSRPLMVGDQLDTDIAAAQAAGMDSLLVMTGVCGRSASDGGTLRATYRADDLRILVEGMRFRVPATTLPRARTIS